MGIHKPKAPAKPTTPQHTKRVATAMKHMGQLMHSKVQKPLKANSRGK